MARTAAGGQPNPIVPLALRDGVITNETGFLIGPRLRLAQNVAWQNFHSTDPLRRRSLGFLANASATPLRTLASGTHDLATHLLGARFVSGNQGVIVDEELTTGHLLVHREVNGTLIADTGNALTQSPDARSAALAFWGSIETPAMFLSHPGLTDPDTYQWDGTDFVPYVPKNGPGFAETTDAAYNPTLTVKTLTGSEVALPAGTYIVVLVNTAANPDKRSEPQTITIPANRVIEIQTALNGDIYVAADGETEAQARLQLAGAVGPHTYRLSTSGTPTTGTPIHYDAAGAGQTRIFVGNTALLVHLDRLFLAKPQTGKKQTLTWFTDPLDPDTIRATNFVTIEDVVTSLFRCSASPIDVGAAAHLLFGCQSSIWVLDGDPSSFGSPQSVLRRLSFGVGIADSSLVCETLFGAVLLATDGQFYLIPPGGQTLQPIGGGNHDIATLYRTSAFAGGAHASLAWAAPYAYYCPNDLGQLWVLDFSQPTPRWWGPLTHKDTLFGGTLPARVWSIGPEDGFSGATKINAGLSNSTDVSGKLYQIDVTAPQITDRTAKLRTGYFHVPDERIALMRLVLTTTRKTQGAFQIGITATAYKADGTFDARLRLLPDEVITPAQDKTIKTVFAWPSLVSDYVYLEIEWPSAIEPDLQDAWVEISPRPRAD